MGTLDRLLDRYQQDHTHPLNRATHLVGIPVLLGALPILVLRPGWGLGLLLLGGALQLLGHAFEGNTPSFVRDPRFVVVGAAWYLRRVATWGRSAPEAEDGGRVRPDHEVLVIGAGLAGLGAGLALQRAGVSDFAILEKTGEVGGTWKVNTYPGVAVDTNSFNYAYSTVPYARWTRAYAPGAEVAAYAEHLADTDGLRARIRFHTEVLSARFDEDTDLWRLSLADGARSAVGS